MSQFFLVLASFPKPQTKYIHLELVVNNSWSHCDVFTLKIYRIHTSSNKGITIVSIWTKYVIAVEKSNFWGKASVFIQMTNYIRKFESFQKLTGLTEKEMKSKAG